MNAYAHNDRRRRFMIASVLGIAITSPSRAGQAGNGDRIETSVNDPSLND
ncbi:hypothetical protein HFO97_21260 [Rhizobium leguminosarum]|nr:hypothetical protein [Rhizobium leguminosarum]MBY5362423.1 hypothetical protein [Rhizobium leguminosarum]